MDEDCGCTRHQKADKRTTGVIVLADGFRGYLGSPCVRDRVVPLLLGGRQEEYLTKEFMQFVYWRSGGKRFCEGNFGNQREQRIDIAILGETRGGDGDGDPGAERKHGVATEVLIEAKYLQNRNRRGTQDNKIDEIRPTLTDLARQLRLKPAGRHAGNRVALRGKTVSVYGLVFCSYVRRTTEADKKNSYFERVLEEAHDLYLQYHDLQKPALRNVYEDCRIRLFGEDWLVSLRSALWRLDKNRPENVFRRSKAQAGVPAPTGD